MKFIIEQVALHPNPERIEEALELMSEIGIEFDVRDHVAAAGHVGGVGAMNEADLAFNYDALKGPELEMLHYTSGKNWMGGVARVSHLGMHCSASELERWRNFFAEREIEVAQEVMTQSHTNPAIKDSRRYNYVIFDTHEILGVDLKFIVRYNVNEEFHAVDKAVA